MYVWYGAVPLDMVLYIAGLSLHRVQKMLTNETFLKTFYQMKEDRRPNASNDSLFSCLSAGFLNEKSNDSQGSGRKR